MPEVLHCARLIVTVAFEGKASSFRQKFSSFFFLCFDLLIVVV